MLWFCAKILKHFAAVMHHVLVGVFKLAMCFDLTALYMSLNNAALLFCVSIEHENKENINNCTLCVAKERLFRDFFSFFLAKTPNRTLMLCNLAAHP